MMKQFKELVTKRYDTDDTTSTASTGFEIVFPTYEDFEKYVLEDLGAIIPVSITANCLPRITISPSPSITASCSPFSYGVSDDCVKHPPFDDDRKEDVLK